MQSLADNALSFDWEYRKGRVQHKVGAFCSQVFWGNVLCDPRACILYTSGCYEEISTHVQMKQDRMCCVVPTKSNTLHAAMLASVENGHPVSAYVYVAWAS